MLINPNLNKIIEVEALRYNWILNNKVKLNNMFDKNKKILFLGDYEKILIKILLNNEFNQKDDLIKLGFEVSFKPHPAGKVKSMDDNITLTDRD